MVQLRSPRPRDIVDRLRTRAEADCPNQCLCHGPDRKTVGQLVKEFVDDPFDNNTHAVYILECKPRSLGNAKKLAYEKRQTDSVGLAWWVKAAAKAQKLIYVGVSKEVHERIFDHANATPSGAHFTNVFPPARILDITWYPYMNDSRRAEPKKARELKEYVAEDTFVFQS